MNHSALAGKRFSKLFVLGHAGYGRKGHPMWLCRCDCGNEKVIFETALTQGRTKSCGCLQSEQFKTKMSTVVGRKYGMLTVLEVIGVDKKRRCLVKCLCDCGTVNTTDFYKLDSGKIRSCGCLCDKTTHGLSKTREYAIWHGIIRRCYNTTGKGYENYGGRGIVVCAEWLGAGGFERFFSDMGPRPSTRHTLERVDNNGPYSKANCVWATRLTQGRNKRNNVTITHDGKTLCVSQWATIWGVPAWRIYQWMDRDGLELSEILKKVTIFRPQAT